MNLVFRALKAFSRTLKPQLYVSAKRHRERDKVINGKRKRQIQRKQDRDIIS